MFHILTKVLCLYVSLLPCQVDDFQNFSAVFSLCKYDFNTQFSIKTVLFALFHSWSYK